MNFKNYYRLLINILEKNPEINQISTNSTIEDQDDELQKTNNTIINLSTKNRFVCLFNNCKKNYSSKISLSVHVQKHHMNSKYKCQWCSKEYSSHNSK
jgi:hypothetical protein